MANTSAIWQHAARTTDQLQSPSCYTEAVPTSPSLNPKQKKLNSGKNVRRQKNEKTETAMCVGRTREEIVKWNQMTALRFQKGGDIRHPRPPFKVF